jgi:FkbM family methyltransferase
VASKLSIVSPSFNQAQFVGRTVRSVSSQDYRELEHIVQDAGSSDGTREILHAHVAAELRCRLFVESDAGQPDAINRGFSRATGEILTWLNTDDYYVDDRVVADVMRIFDEEPGVDVVYGRGCFVSPEGEVLREAFVHRDPRRLPHSFFNSVGILQPATFFRRRILDRAGPLDAGMLCAFDYDLWARFMRRGARFRFIDRILAHATFHENAKSSALRLRQLQESSEVTKRHYGPASAEWVARAVECAFLGTNGIVDSSDPRIPDAVATDLMDRTVKVLFRRYNASNPPKRALLSSPDLPDYRKSRDLARDTGLVVFDRVIATSFDDAYIDQGLTLIHSIRKHEGRATPIVVYDLNLSLANCQLLAGLDNVHLVPFPRDAVASYPGFLQPKNYGYKCSAIKDAARFVGGGGIVLWIDAGVAALRPLEPIFDLIRKDEVFFVNHDDRPEWPIYNGTFCHPEAVKVLGASLEELLGEHLCSCFIGYRKDGKYQALFDDADRFARIKDAIVWTKHPAADDKVGYRHPAMPALRRFAKAQGRISPARRQEVFDAFGYYGHRQDQSVFSILAARYGAPVQSAHAYCRSDDGSSRASKLNWESGSVSLEVVSSAKVPEQIAGAVTYHHRGMFVESHRADDARADSRTLIVVGDGPSLTGFDFRRLKSFDAIGLSTSYRLWDQIGWYPRYYLCLDEAISPDHKHQVARLIQDRKTNGIELFVLRRKLLDELAEGVAAEDCILDFDELRATTKLLGSEPVATASHAALVGAFLGYDRIVLMGAHCDREHEEGSGGQARPQPESWRAVASLLAAQGVKVWDGSAASTAGAIPGRDFGEIEREEIELRNQGYGGIGAIGEFERKDGASLDETRVIAALVDGSRSVDNLMIDVGAHHGGAMTPFLDKGWKVFAFEPDSTNRRQLDKRIEQHPNHGLVKVDPRAVSKETRKGVPFYASEVSTGISGLSAFHSSHQKSGEVDTVTLRDALAGEALAAVGFLKIDTEGHDLFVLQGFPWERCEPRIIECEFEDSKTTPLGYSFHDLAGFLVAKGYKVYVSEWHPVVRYGIRHDWKRLARYPCELSDPRAWGNLLAFREPIEEELLAAAVRKSILLQPAPARRTRSATLVILGNGPSLKGFDFARFRDFDAIGMNAAYRYWGEIGWYPRYYICLDKVVGLSHKDPIARLIRERAKNGIEGFLLRRNLIDELPRDLADLDCVLDFDRLMTDHALLSPTPITTGSHAALFGVLLGYDRMVLMGIDNNYVEKVPGAEEKGGTVLELAETPADNPNYFFSNYQVAGDRFNIPNPLPDMHRNSWRAVAPILAERSVKVWNGSAISTVDVFERRDFKEIETEEAAIRSRAANSGNESQGVNWSALKGRAQGSTYTWSLSDGRAVATLTARRHRELLAVLTGNISRIGDRAKDLRVEVDGVPVPSSLRNDLRPACLVVRLPARDRTNRNPTKLALSLPATKIPEAGAGGSVDQVLADFVRLAPRVSLVPCEPSLPVTFERSRLRAWMRRVRLSPRGDTAGDFPLSHFDGLAYLQAYPDVAEAVLAGRTSSALEHYRLHGYREGRRFSLISQRKPNEGSIADAFDGAAYLHAHFDVAGAIRAGTVSSALEHYVQSGRSEGRRVMIRLDGTACRGDRVDLVRLDSDREINARMADLRKKTDDNIQRLNARIAVLSKKMDDDLQGLNASLSAERTKSASLQRSLEEIRHQAAATATRLSQPTLDTFNVVGYQAHSRGLTAASANRLLEHWVPLLGLEVQKKELYYLAHRVSNIESACVGRLAASIDDILVRILVARAIRSRNVDIIEIGALFGLGIGILHEVLTPFVERVHFTVIDPLDGYYGKENRDILTGVPISRATFEENLRRTGVEAEDVTLIQHLSTDAKAVKATAKRSYDLLVIDGDHTYEGVKHDTDTYLRMVRPGGYVLFDDYSPELWPGVKEFVDAEVLTRKDLTFLGAEWRTAVFQVMAAGSSQ